jgi:uncharacterized protein (DUF302 family)
VLLAATLLVGCNNQQATDVGSIQPLAVGVPEGLPAVDYSTGLYEVAVHDGVSYEDVVDSLKSISEGMNFVNPANFPIGDHMRNRDQNPPGVLEVRAFCNLGMGAEIMLDHPEFIAYAPCRIALYEKPSADKQLQLYLALARPSFDLQSIKNPTARAKKAAVQLEEALIVLMDKASKGDF